MTNSSLGLDFDSFSGRLKMLEAAPSLIYQAFEIFTESRWERTIDPRVVKASPYPRWEVYNHSRI